MEKLTLDTHLWNRMRSPTPRNDLNIAPRVTKLKNAFDRQAVIFAE